jgi:hypothetical protein
MLPERLFPRLGLGIVLVVALAVAACGGQPAPAKSGYSCTFTNSYCAAYVTFAKSAFTGNPPINGAYAYMDYANLTCTGACAVSSSAGYIANMLMLVSSDNSTWVESGVWNDGYINQAQGFLGPGISFVYGVGIKGIPTYRPTMPIGQNSADLAGISFEIKNFGGTNGTSDFGYAFRYGLWASAFGGVTPYSPDSISISMPNNAGLQAACVCGIDHLEIGEFLHGTSGATADDTFVYPPRVFGRADRSFTNTSDFPAIDPGFPDNLYPIQLGTSSAGIPLQSYHATESLTFSGGNKVPVAVGSPPYGAWLHITSNPATGQWSMTSDSDPTKDLMVFTCCGGSFN